MQIFLNWSGKRSKKVAELLMEWIPEVIPVAKPWMSVDIEKGERWIKELQEKLDLSEVGIFCLTKESVTSRWTYFEAGALVNLKDVKIHNVLIDISSSDLHYPLAHFPHTILERKDLKRLFHSINSLTRNYGAIGLKEKVLEHTFGNSWSRFDEKLQNILKDSGDGKMSTFQQPVLGSLDTSIGIELQEVLDRGLTLDEIINGVIKNVIPPSTKKVTPKVVSFLANKIKTQELTKLIKLGYITEQDGMYKLTENGQIHFSNAKNDVGNHVDEIMDRNDENSNPKTGRQIVSIVPSPIQKKLQDIDIAD